VSPRGRSPERVEVAVVGGGPAGALAAAWLARAGREVVLLEGSPAYRWRACGVFSSPATVTALRRAGLDEATLRRVARPIPAMRVEDGAGTTFRLTYGDDGSPWRSAVGFDRSALDPALLGMASDAGASVRLGMRVERIDLRADGSTLDVRGPDGDGQLVARLVVGADGRRSLVARTAGVARAARLRPRVGLTYHLAERANDDARAVATDPPIDARMRVLRDGYVGIAPVPGGRVNVGIVLGSSWSPELARDGAPRVAERILATIQATDADRADWRHGTPLDRTAGASPIGHRVTRRAGDGWLLVGDAAGFLDPFTGEGLHRAVVSAELGARAVDAALRGDRDALGAYDRAMRRRFGGKDVLSWMIQGFLGRPVLFGYAARRLAARDRVRETMGLVIGDLVPASRALDPRYLAALLRP
jgi:flavin-dependent dehydrogenase